MITARQLATFILKAHGAVDYPVYFNDKAVVDMVLSNDGKLVLTDVDIPSDTLQNDPTDAPEGSAEHA